MVNILAIVGITIGVALLGGGAFYLLWLWTRPKKIHWQARIYQLGEGVKPPVKNKRGEIVSKLRLNDLRPYAKDVITRVEKKGGVTYYELETLGKTVPAVTSDVVEVWGEKEKIVDVLIVEDSCTLLKKGYDKVTGQEIYQPLPHSRTNQIKAEIVLRKERLQERKDILQAITPWIVTGIAMLGMVGITYFLISGAVEISANLKEGQKEIGDSLVEAAKINREAILGESGELDRLQKEEPPIKSILDE